MSTKSLSELLWNPLGWRSCPWKLSAPRELWLRENDCSPIGTIEWGLYHYSENVLKTIQEWFQKSPCLICHSTWASCLSSFGAPRILSPCCAPLSKLTMWAYKNISSTLKNCTLLYPEMSSYYHLKDLLWAFIICTTHFKWFDIHRDIVQLIKQQICTKTIW